MFSVFVFVLVFSSTHSRPSESSCTENLPFPHPTDCAKYYDCAPWGPQERNCPFGTHFNPTIHVCDWPSNAGCEVEITTSPLEATTSNSTSSNSSSFGPSHCTEKIPFPHPSDCTKYYDCTPWGRQERDCPLGTYFNPTIHVCDWPSNAGCQEETTTSSLEPTTSNSTSSNSSTSGPSHCTKKIPFPHPSDCTKYYDCTPWGRQERDCPLGTHFNPTIHVCDWPSNAGCQVETTTSPFEPTTSNSTSSNSSTSAPSHCTEKLPFPHPSDCTKYYDCTPWGRQERDCPLGTHFNPTIHVCDWPSNAGCQVETTTSPFEPTTSNSTSSNSSTSGPSQCTENLPYPHPSDCTKYYDCTPWGRQERECPFGTHFNPTVHVCDWPWNAECEITTTINEDFGDLSIEDFLSTETNEEGEFEDTTTDSLSSNTVTPEDFTSTETNEEEEFEDTTTDSLSSNTVTPEDIISTETNKEEELEETTTEVTSVSSSSLQPEPWTPEDIISTPEPGEEEKVEEASTEPSSSSSLVSLTPDDLSTPQTTTVTSSLPPLTSSSASPSTSVNLPSTSPPEEKSTITPDNICAQKPEELFVSSHPQDCKVFITCSHGFAIVMACPGESQYFNPNSNTCSNDPTVCS